MKEVGDKTRFALLFEFYPDPDAASPARIRESWGQLQVWVGGINLTCGISASGELLDSAECPLLPIVEWFLANWDELFHESRLPRPTGNIRTLSSAGWHSHVLESLPADDDELDRLLDDRQTWWKRHGLGAALQDFRIPDLHIRRRNESIELSWNDSEWRSVPHGVQLTVQPGTSALPVEEVCDVVEAWCREVLDALAPSLDVSAERHALSELRLASRARTRLALAAGLQKLERVARRIRAMAGLQDGDISPTVERLLGMGASPSGQLYAKLTVPVMLYRSARPDLSEQDLETLFNLTTRVGTGNAPAFEKARAPSPCPLVPEEATAHGYELAEQLRAALGIPNNEPLVDRYDLESHVVGTLGIDVVDATLDDRGVEGIAIWLPDRLPLIVINVTGRFASTPWGRRMTIAHEICHLLSDGSMDVGLGIVSNPWAPRLMERRANAFAAMLLAPPAALARYLPMPSERWTTHHLVRAMYKLGIGATTLCRQLQNVGWISRRDSEAWLEQLASRATD